ncbi:hypothetical protein C8P67_10325 [Flavobacterium aquicola]|uniref:Uncharacterized protein n=1 Tax=Flavobacterium aquicola TaxID=1682742 RepID=A0A3E0EP94_9FLAO|nr:hypothetical protein C8P67_10325 [Flavobacterium aquicola]
MIRGRKLTINFENEILEINHIKNEQKVKLVLKK